MTWSTRELADLAGTTINTVRHYHALGILAEPERRFNGWKQYRVEHLVSLIRARRLVELGVPLAQISEIDTDAIETMRELDTELGSAIDRLHRVRADVAAITQARAPLDCPRGFESVAGGRSAADLSLLHVYARVPDEAAHAELRAKIEREPAPVQADFDALDEGTDEITRQRLSHEIARTRSNWRAVSAAGSLGQALAQAREELFNDAQKHVITRATGWVADSGTLHTSTRSAAP